MTEQEWLGCNDPHPMLAFLMGNALIERKQRLFAVACSRRMWDWIDDLGRAAVEAAEKFADGSIGSEEMRAARLACQGAGGQAAWYAAATIPAVAARNAARSAQAGVASNAQIGTEPAELAAQANLLRDIFGNPFHPIILAPPWLLPAVVDSAQKIYDNRDFDGLRSLADALEEAGCDNADILAHCRGPGPHVRGCWGAGLDAGEGVRQMPWELNVKSERAAPSLKSNDWPLLGSGEDVCRRIADSLPTLQWHRESSFIEQHQHLPEDHPIRKFIADSTVEQKQWSSRPKFKGLYEGEGFTLEFFVQDGPINFFQIDVRGGGNPLPSLAKLCQANKWAVEDVTGKAVDLNLPFAPGWEDFMQWRDRAIVETSEKRQLEERE